MGLPETLPTIPRAALRPRRDQCARASLYMEGSAARKRFTMMYALWRALVLVSDNRRRGDDAY